MKNFSLIVPTFKEEKNIQALFFEIEKVAKKIDRKYTFEVIVIDDSPDKKTVRAVLSFKKRSPLFIKIIHRKSRGLASAVLKGFSKSRGDIIGVIDADLSHPPVLLLKMIEKIQIGDIVVGSRYIEGGYVEEWPIIRRYGSLFCTKITRILGIRISDPLSGLFILKRSVVDSTQFNPMGYKILLEILVKGNYETIIEIPYVFKNRKVGNSKMNMRTSMDYFHHILRLLLWRLKHKK